MNAHSTFQPPRPPLSSAELKRRAAALARSKYSGSSLSILPQTRAIHLPAHREAIESCLRTIHRAIPHKKAIVLKMMARDAFEHARAAGVDHTEVFDRLWDAAQANGLAQEHGRDTIRKWLGDAMAVTEIEDVVNCSGSGRLDVSIAPIPGNERRLISQRASDIKPEVIEWIWPGRIAVGKLTLIGGKPGLGKSQVTTFIAATVSNGGRWPCEEGTAPTGSVVFFSAEDGAADTIVPRLIGIGADLSRIEIPFGVTDANGRRTFNLKADIDLLEVTVRSLGDVRLIVIDPISAYMGKADGNGNVETRAVLEPIAEMANRLRIAVVAVTHLNKGSGSAQGAMERFAGSIAFIAAARAGFVITEDDEKEEQRLFLQVKNNIAPTQKCLAFRLEQRPIAGDIVVSGVVWHGQHVERTADEALAATERPSRRERSGKDDAADFLRSALADSPLPVRVLQGLAVEAGLLEQGKHLGQSKAFRSARHILGIKPRHEGGAAGAGHWVWELPEGAKMPAKTYDAPQIAEAS